MKQIKTPISVVVLALAALLVLLPGAAMAANFEVLGWNTGYTINAVAPGATSGSSPRSISASGGEFYVNIEGLGSGVAYCIDPWQSIGQGQHDFTWFGQPSDANSSNTTILTSLGGLEAAYLIQHYSQVLTGQNDPAGIGMKEERTALQLALWEVVFDTDGGYDVTTGAFHLVDQHGLSASIVDRANFMLSSLPTAGGGQFSPAQLAYLDSHFRVGGKDGIQDLVGGVAAQTPEPGTMLLFGTALLGSGFFRRRRRKEEE